MSFIDKDYFLKFSGIDIEVEFENSNFDTDDAYQMFINRVEDTAIAILKDRYDNEDFENKVNGNLEEFKKGMAYQVYDKLKKGETNTLNETAFTIWRNIGLCNLRRC
jgi:hypothetical protein